MISHILSSQIKEADAKHMSKLKGLVYSTSPRRPKVETVMAVAEYHLLRAAEWEALALEVRRLEKTNPVKKVA